MPDYSHFDGKPYVLARRPMHQDFRYDAWRTLANPAIDWVWWRADPWVIEQSNRVLTFLASQGDNLAPCYTLEGEPIADNDRPIGLMAMAGVAALAADRAIGEPWVRKLWELEFSEGRYRYYSGLLHVLALLQVSGGLLLLVGRYVPLGLTLRCMDTASALRRSVQRMVFSGS
jgi:oligosaccharide reducing-end xylanase